MSCCPKIQKLKNSAADISRSLSANMAHALKTGETLADDPTVERRVSSCQKCEQFTGMRCRECGCFVHLKASLVIASCPLNKW